MYMSIKEGAILISEDQDNQDLLIVLARVPDDIARIFPASQISQTAQSDYPYRARVARDERIATTA